MYVQDVILIFDHQISVILNTSGQCCGLKTAHLDLVSGGMKYSEKFNMIQVNISGRQKFIQSTNW